MNKIVREISLDLKNELDEHVNEMIDSLCAIVELMQDNKIDARKINWISELNTALSGQLEFATEYPQDPNNNKTYEHWINNLEVCSDIQVPFHFVDEEGVETVGGGMVNMASGKVECDDERMFSDTISRIYFVYEDNEFNVCMECGENFENPTCRNCSV